MWPSLESIQVMPPSNCQTHDYRTQVSLVRSMGPVVFMSLQDLFENLTDVTLVDEDTKSILTENANRAIQGNQAMHVT